MEHVFVWDFDSVVFVVWIALLLIFGALYLLMAGISKLGEWFARLRRK